MEDVQTDCVLCQEPLHLRLALDERRPKVREHVRGRSPKLDQPIVRSANLQVESRELTQVLDALEARKIVVQLKIVHCLACRILPLDIKEFWTANRIVQVNSKQGSARAWINNPRSRSEQRHPHVVDIAEKPEALGRRAARCHRGIPAEGQEFGIVQSRMEEIS